jgi:hypothetical protein
MRAAFARLARDGWVLGIAAAIAIGYGVVSFVTAIADAVVAAAEKQTVAGLFGFEVAGVGVGLREVVSSGVTLAAVVLIAAVALRGAERPPADDGQAS